MPPVLSLPTRHPSRVAVRGRRGRVGLEAQLLRRLGDAIHQEVLVPVVAVLAHDSAELSQLAIQHTRDRIPPKHHDLVQPVGKQRDVRREGKRRTRYVRARVHRREVEDVGGRHQDLGQERIHGDQENQVKQRNQIHWPFRPRERRNRTGQQQCERAIPRVVGQRIVQERVVPQVVGDHPRPHHVHPDEAAHRYRHARGARTKTRARPLSDARPGRIPGLVAVTAAGGPTRASQSNRAQAATGSHRAPEPPQQAWHDENGQDGG